MQNPVPLGRLAIAVVGTGVGLAVGVSGVLPSGSTTAPAVPALAFAAPTVEGVGGVSRIVVTGTDCPDGLAIGELQGGDHVLALRRSGDAVEVRDPRDLGRTMWIDTRWLVPDADSPMAFADLPEGDCDDGLLTAVAPTTETTLPPNDLDQTSTTTPATTAPPATTPPTTRPAVTPTTRPGPVSPPTTQPPPADTTDPSLGALETIGSNELCEHPSPSGAWPTTITYRIAASDDVGVATVVASWPNGPSGLPGGPVTFTRTDATFQATVGPFPATALSSGDRTVTVTITATDAAGNTTATTTSLTLIDQGDCLV